MKEESIRLIKEVIENWFSNKYYTYEKKEVLSSKSPVVDGEYILKFTNEVNGFFYKGEAIIIRQESKLFPTMTLGRNPLSDNVNSDKYRLIKFLDEFDTTFYAYVNDKLTGFNDTVFTSDPLFFK